jgi:CBS domain-containing protein
VRAEDFMTAAPYCVPAGTPLEEVAFEMSAHKFGSVLVTDEDGNVSGIFTSIDALNALVEVLRGEAQ